jgi:hypothetical protein
MAILSEYSVRTDILLSGRVATGTSATFVNPDELEMVTAYDYSFGTGAGKCNQNCYTVITLAAGTGGNPGATTIDLTATLTNHAGQTVNLSKVRRLHIKNKSSSLPIVWDMSVATPFVGPFGGTNPTVTIQPGVLLPLENPTDTAWAVSSSIKNLKLTNASQSTTVDVELYIAGEGS